MSGEEDFEVLVSTEDFLRIQSRCQDLQVLKDKLESENKQMSNKIYQMKQQNASLSKKITSLTDDVKYLSQKGIQMSKNLLNLEIQKSDLKIAKAESQKQLSVKFQKSIQSNIEMQKKLFEIINESTKVKQQLKKKSVSLQKILNVEKMSRHIQVAPNSLHQSCSTDLTLGEMQKMRLRNQNLQTIIAQRQKTIKQFQKQIQQKTLSLERQQKTYQELKSDVKLKSSSIVQFQQQIRQLKQELENKESKTQQLETNLAQTNQRNNFHQKQKAEMAKIMENLETEKKRILKQSQQQINVVIKQFEQVNQQKIKLQAVMNSKQEQIRMKQAEIQSLLNIVRNLENTVRQGRQLQIKLLEQLQSFKNSKKQVQVELEKTRQGIEQERTNMLNQIKEKSQMLDHQALNHKQMILHLQKQKKQLKQLLESQRQKQAKASEDKIKLLNDQLQQTKIKMQSICLQRQALMCALQEKQVMIEELIMKQSEATSKIQSQDNYIKKIVQQKNTESQRILQLKDIVQSISNQKKLLQNEAYNFSMELNQVIKVNEQTLTKINKANKQLEDRIAIQNAQLLESNNLIKDLESEKMRIHKELNQKVIDLKQQIESIIESKNIMQKQFEEIIQGMELEKKANIRQKSGSKENQKDQLQILKATIQEYFVTLGCNLLDVGNLKSEDIAQIMNHQEDVIMKEVKKSIKSFVGSGQKLSHAKSLK